MQLVEAETSSTNHHRQPELEPEPSGAEHSTPRVLVILSLVLERLVARNDQIVLASGHGSVSQAVVAKGLGYVGAAPEPTLVLGKNMKVFDGVRAPSISVLKYLQRIYKYAKCSPSCFVVGYVYMDRLVHRHPELLVVSLNVHRLLVTSVMVASKMLDDDHYDNAFYARVGGVSNSEMNRLELELLFLLDFDLMVKASELEIYCLYLEREMSCLTVNGFTTTVEKPSTLITNATATTMEKDEEDLIYEIAVQLDEQIKLVD